MRLQNTHISLQFQNLLRTGYIASVSLHDYLELVDYSGRAILENKRGHTSSEFPPILQRLGIDQTAWLDNIQKFEERFNLAVGTIEKLQAMAQQLKQKWLKGKSAAKQLYQASPG